MAGNHIGKAFVISCFGESHGRCVAVVIDGCPAGLQLSAGDLQEGLNRRIPHKPEIVSARREKDVVELLSGVFKGFTTGSPVCTLVWNKEAVPGEYELVKDIPRPGHADYTARMKYGGFNDHRGGGRFSGRITVAFVMAGEIARKLLRLFGIEVLAYTVEIGGIKIRNPCSLEAIREDTYRSSVRCPDMSCSQAMEEVILEAKQEGDSVGGAIECVALNVPVGVGEPLFDSLDADISKMLFDIPAVKGVEFGAGFKVAQLKGSENNDSYTISDEKITAVTNNSGGVLGGISSGMPILARLALKPPPSISKVQQTVDLKRMKQTSISIKGRHDPCIVPKAVPVVESAVAIVLVDHMIRAGFIPKVLGRK